MTEKELFDLSVSSPDGAVYSRSKKIWDSIAKPIDGLGILEELIAKIAAIQGTPDPDISKRALVVLCADNGVVAEGVSQCDQKVTADVARLLGQKKSTVCVMTKQMAVDVIPVDMGIDCEETIPGVLRKKVCRITGNIAKEPAMTKQQCLTAIATGMELARDCEQKGYRLIATGEMGIGNTTTATALLCALTGEKPENITGRGAGLSEQGLQRKIQVIRQALKVNPLPEGSKERDPYRTLCALQKLGGPDLAGLMGLFIGGALRGIPVVIDGLISAVAALAAEYIVPGTSAYMLASHAGREQGTISVLNRLGLQPVIHGDMALGEGTGAVLLIPMLDMAMSLYKEGVRFNDTPIDAYERFEGS